MSTLSKLILFQVTISFGNELCYRDKWNIISGQWTYNSSNCIVNGYDTYYNATTWIWFGEQGNDTGYPSWNEAKFDTHYANKYYTLELTFKMNINLSELSSSASPHCGIIWKASRVSPQHNVGQAYYAGLLYDGQYRFGSIYDNWVKYMDRYIQEFDKDMTTANIINSIHVIRVDIIGSIYRFYLNQQFYFEYIQTELPNGTIGVRSKKAPATYYSLNLTVHNKTSSVIQDLPYHGTVFCGDNIQETIKEYELLHYKFIITNESKIIFGMYGTLVQLEFHLFDADFNVILHCKTHLECDEMHKTDNQTFIILSVASPGEYLIIIGAPDSENKGSEYGVNIMCTSTDSATTEIPESDGSMKFGGNIWFIIALSVVFVVLICICPPVLWFWFKRDTKPKGKNQAVYIKNGLAAIICIGTYHNFDNQHDSDMQDIDDGDVENAHFHNMDMRKDYYNFKTLFQVLNYKIMPQNIRTKWTESQVFTYLKDDIGKEISKLDENGNLVYDGLIVCISSHGLQNQIVTSDYRVIEKTAIHRIISVTYPKTRDIPRIFLFDSCEGSAERVKSMGLIRKPTIDFNEYQNCVMDQEQKHYERNQKCRDLHKGNSVNTPRIERPTSRVKAIGLQDIRSNNEWTEHGKNPDYKLVTIYGANPGFQAKFNSINGSYLVYEFTKKMTENLNVPRQDKKTLGELFMDIQNDLHDRGKQQTINVFNNNTQFIQFQVKKPSKIELKDIKEEDDDEEDDEEDDDEEDDEVIEIPKMPTVSRKGYESVCLADMSEDEIVLKETLQDVLRNPSVASVPVEYMVPASIPASIPFSTIATAGSGSRSRTDSLDSDAASCYVKPQSV